MKASEMSSAVIFAPRSASNRVFVPLSAADIKTVQVRNFGKYLEKCRRIDQVSIDIRALSRKIDPGFGVLVPIPTSLFRVHAKSPHEIMGR